MTLVQLAIVLVLMATALVMAGLLVLRAKRKSRIVPVPASGASETPAQAATSPRHKKETRSGDPAPVRMRSVSPQRILGNECAIGTSGAPASYFDDVEARLEHAFEMHTRGRISIATYCRMIEAMLIEAKGEVARFSGSAVDASPADTYNPYLQASWAVEAIEWCRDWALAQTEDADTGAAPEAGAAA